jgi:hypothetical protein
MPDSNQVEPAARDRLPTFTLTLLIIALWLTTRPYPGTDNDARFYTFEALYALHPEHYINDLYFQFGSQDQFTLFTKLFAPIVGALGISAANISVLLAGQALWLAGLFYFASGLVSDRRTAWIATACVIILPFHIGFIEPGEAFLTPRIFAFGLSMLALGALLRGRRGLCIAILVIATPIHPLIALGCFGVFFVHQALMRPLWWAAAAAAGIAGMALALAGIQPFNRIFTSFDPAWFKIIYLRDSFCFVANFGFYIWLPIISATALGLYAMLVASPRQFLFLRASLIVGVAGILATYIGGDLLKNELILDAQLWRAFWPFGIASYLMFPRIAETMPWRGAIFFFQARFYLGLTLLYLFLTFFFAQMWLIASPFAVITAALAMFEHRFQKTVPDIAGLAAFIAGLTLAGLSLYGLYLAFINLTFNSVETFSRLFLAILVLGLLAAALNIGGHFGKFSHRPSLIGLALLAACLCACDWDAEPPWLRYIDNARNPPPDLAALLPAGPIYWEGSATTPWFLLQRSSYFSCDQGTGTLFSRGTAIAYQQRFDSFAKLGTQDFIVPEICPAAPGATSHPVTQAMLAEVCRAQPALAAMILLHDIPGAPHKTWVAPANFSFIDPFLHPPELVKTNRFYIYDCADLK